MGGGLSLQTVSSFVVSWRFVSDVLVAHICHELQLQDLQPEISQQPVCEAGVLKDWQI